MNNITNRWYQEVLHNRGKKVRTSSNGTQTNSDFHKHNFILNGPTVNIPQGTFRHCAGRPQASGEV